LPLGFAPCHYDPFIFPPYFLPELSPSSRRITGRAGSGSALCLISLIHSSTTPMNVITETSMRALRTRLPGPGPPGGHKVGSSWALTPELESKGRQSFLARQQSFAELVGFRPALLRVADIDSPIPSTLPYLRTFFALMLLRRARPDSVSSLHPKTAGCARLVLPTAIGWCLTRAFCWRWTTTLSFSPRFRCLWHGTPLPPPWHVEDVRDGQRRRNRFHGGGTRPYGWRPDPWGPLPSISMAKRQFWKVERPPPKEKNKEGSCSSIARCLYVALPLLSDLCPLPCTLSRW